MNGNCRILTSRNHVYRNRKQTAQSMVRQEGIEPPTYSLEGCCSIQLSYWRFVRKEDHLRRLP